MTKDENLTLALIKHHLIAIIIGAIIGFGTRLSLGAHRTNEQILQSHFGLAGFLGVGLGITGLLSGWQRIRPIRYYLGLTLLVASIVWVIPL